MSEHTWRKVSILAIGVIALLMAPSLITTSATDSLYGAPDLAVTELSMVPTRDGFEGTLKIKNLGLSSTVDVAVLVMDLQDGSGKNRSVVVAFPLLSLGPDKEFVKVFKWVPEVTGTHIITAMVDTESDEKERSERNNVRSITISLPFIRSATSAQDGIPDPEVLGEYISGIENRVDLSIGFEDVADPSLIRVYAVVPGQFLEYGTRTSGSTFVASFDAGSLPVGDHLLSINSTYCGNPLSQKFYIIRIVPVPVWFGDLDRRHSYFDKDLSSYVLTGKLDIDPCVIRTEADGIGDLEEMVLNSEEGEVQLTGYILLDGTTTITARTDMVMEGPRDSRYSFSDIQEGKIFLPSPFGAFSLDLSGSSDLEMELTTLALGRKLVVDGFYRDTIELPLPALTLHGEVTASTTLRVMDDGHIAPMESKFTMDLSGNTTDMVSMDLPGYDAPSIAISTEASLKSSLRYSRSNWTGSGNLKLTPELCMSDMGLQMGSDDMEWVPEPFGVGTAISLSPGGDFGRLELSVRDGHTTHLIYANSTVESEVYRNNTYKSHPALGYLQDGSPIVVWSEAGYMEGLANRTSSLRLYYKLGNANGTFPGDPMRFSPEKAMDQYPALASDHSRNRLVLVFIRDMDGDILTLDDREVLASFFDGATWSAPERLTNDSMNDREPDAWFDEEGGLHVVWVSQGGMALYSKWTYGSGWSTPSTIDIGAERYIEEVSFAKAKGADPMVLSVISEPGAPYVLAVGKPSVSSSALTNITSSEHLIGSSSMVEGPDGSLDTIWREWSFPGGDLFSSTNPDMTKGVEWTKPLRLTSTVGLELSPVLYRKRDSTFDLGLIEIPLWDGNSSTASSPVFTNRNLSWGGEIVSFSVSDNSATPGTMVLATAAVEYRGMASSGMVRVDLYRLLRDKDTGGLTEEFWESEFVDFHRPGQAEQVSFTVPVKEFQLGYVAVTVPTLSGIPAHTSQKFSSLPSLPDLEIISMESEVKDPTSPIATVHLSMKNWGTVAAGSRTLRVLGSPPSAPAVFRNGSLEPLYLRDRDTALELNSTVVDIPAGGTLSVTLNITLSPGANHIWSRLEGPSWLPTAESPGHSVLQSFPSFKLESGPLPSVLEAGSNLTIAGTVVNNGPWPLNVSYGHMQAPLPEGLEERPPTFGIGIFVTFGGMEIFTNRTSIPFDAEKNGSASFNWTTVTMEAPGRMDITMTLEGSHSSIPFQTLHSNLLQVVDPGVVVLGFQQTIVGDRFTGSIDVVVHNPNHYDAEAVHLTLYNGYPSDNVVVSEMLVVELASGETRTVTMDLGLEKGLYVLSLTAETFEVHSDDASEKWTLTDTISSDIQVKDPGPLELPVNKDVDMGEVTTAGIISASTIMFVLVVASLFYRREHEEDKDDEEKV